MTVFRDLGSLHPRDLVNGLTREPRDLLQFIAQLAHSTLSMSPGRRDLFFERFAFELHFGDAFSQAQKLTLVASFLGAGQREEIRLSLVSLGLFEPPTQFIPLIAQNRCKRFELFDAAERFVESLAHFLESRFDGVFVHELRRSLAPFAHEFELPPSAGDRVHIFVEEMTDDDEKLDIVMLVRALTAFRFAGFEFFELGLPVAQHVGFEVQEFGNLADFEERLFRNSNRVQNTLRGKKKARRLGAPQTLSEVRSVRP